MTDDTYIHLPIHPVCNDIYMRPKETKISRQQIKTDSNRYTYTYDHEKQIITGTNKHAIGYGDTYEIKIRNTVP